VSSPRVVSIATGVCYMAQCDVPVTGVMCQGPVESTRDQLQVLGTGYMCHRPEE